ncbi:MAG: preprotein translocase subunit SecG [Candidatus Omnitrophota bacterium]|nr:preprotein translocase subunit SecG [Candidatus Omnitrophota bacterium]
MLYGLIIITHILICLLLVGIVLIQSGRGGGLTENFSSMESLFGTRTNSFLTRATAVLATLFITTCLLLTLMSTKRSRSLIQELPQKAVESVSVVETTQKPIDTATGQDTKQDKPEANPAQLPESKSNAAETPAK